MTHTILERERLTLSAITLAQALSSAGYATGIFGKWHLGDESAYQPERRGFQEVFIHGGGGIGQTYPGSCGDAPGNTYFDPTILHNGRFERTRGYCTDVFFAQAMRWMDGRPRSQPFFAYITPNAPHAPLQVRPEDEARYAGRVRHPQAAKYLGMVANIDDNVGRLLDHLAARGTDRHTLVIFMTDNGSDGGLLADYNAGMRGGKGTAFLGGTRAVSFWRWPGRIAPGTCTELSAHLDVLPTLLEISGASVTRQLRSQMEGRSLVPLLEQPALKTVDRMLFTHLGRWARGTDPEMARYRTCAVRTTRWHLVSPDGNSRPHWQLFDIKNDPGESHDVSGDHPEAVADLALRYDRWWESMPAHWVNETSTGPRMNPFKVRYWAQFGGGPSPQDLQGMDFQQNPATRPGSR